MPSRTAATTFIAARALGLGLFVLACAAAQAEEKPAAPPRPLSPAEQLFQQRIWPLFNERCLACHGNGPEKIKGAFDLRSRQTALAGGASGEAAIIPGHPDKSPLLAAVRRSDDDTAMPPKENDKLSREQIKWIREWIKGGAPWPEIPVAKKPGNDGGVIVATSGGLSPAWEQRPYQPEDIWAYQPVRPVAVPADVIDASRVFNPLDAFIQQRLKAKGIAALAPRADRATFIRRAAIDLTGLPPAPEDTAAFAADNSPEAAQKLIERLLASPRYGEQQARHWLDVARYADTNGFSNDFERPHAWRYRDYLVRAFNADKPYDRFILEQLAGDELEPHNPEMLIAVGFLRSGPWEHTGMSVAAVTRQQWLDDVTHSVGVSFLGQGLRCASCHDHKFDPVPTRDYYRIQACFAATHFAERDVAYFPVENTRSFEDGRKLTTGRIDAESAVYASFRKKNEEAIAAFLKQYNVKSLDEIPQDKRPNRGEIGFTKDEISLRKISEKRRQYFERELKRYEPHAFSVYSGPANGYMSTKPINSLPQNMDGEVPAMHILIGGALESPQAAVTPGVLSAVHGSNDRLAPSPWNTIPATVSGRRLGLARWIASPQNPLTARVMVNRVWQQHFGRGIVATPNSFGKMGGRPTHPELLDWLAAWFVDNGWSIKKLHALIMTSNLYQQAGEHPRGAELLRIDPRNQLLAYFPARRLHAEEIRDAMLAVTGELNTEMGGPGAFPEINWEVAFQPRHIMGSVAPAYQPSPTPPERNRRTLYAFRFRTLADPMLEVFNRPGSEISCECRDETTVAPQAFSLMNAQFVHNRALALAVALQKQGGNVAAQIRRAYELIYGRAPAAAELAACEAHVARMRLLHDGRKLTPAPLPTTIKRHMVEEMTGEDVYWEEKLDVLMKYKPDLMPWDVGADTRALADLCLVLLNSNEFLYLR